MIRDDLDRAILGLTPAQRSGLVVAAAEMRDQTHTPALAPVWHALAMRAAEVHNHVNQSLAAMADDLGHHLAWPAAGDDDADSST